MLDPVSAIGLASSIIQIVEFGCKLVSQTQEIYYSASGATKNNVTSVEITTDIRSLLKDLTRKDQDFQRLDPDDIALGKLVDSCEHEANALMHLLKQLEVHDATQWQSFRQAIKNAREKGKVKEIERRLLKLQKQIDFRLHVMMTYVLGNSIFLSIGLNITI